MQCAVGVDPPGAETKRPARLGTGTGQKRFDDGNIAGLAAEDKYRKAVSRREGGSYGQPTVKIASAAGVLQSSQPSAMAALNGTIRSWIAGTIHMCVLLSGRTRSGWQTREAPVALRALFGPRGDAGMSATMRPPRSPVGATDIESVIVIDSREQTPLPFSKLATVTGTLVSGDYSVCGLEELFSVERKSIEDLVSCCCAGNRERFERELHRLRGFRFKRLLIVGSEEAILAERYRSAITPKAVLATLGAFEVRYDLPVVFKSTPEAAAAQIERWAHWFSREVRLAAINLSRAAKEVACG